MPMRAIWHNNDNYMLLHIRIASTQLCNNHVNIQKNDDLFSKAGSNSEDGGDRRRSGHLLIQGNRMNAICNGSDRGGEEKLLAREGQKRFAAMELTARAG
ncbi:MAG: hypothetical protein LBD68_06320, partial [Zoogloeaceae bacterium]|nr:hypothetical protein [Zoogloeaceae bacterium]